VVFTRVLHHHVPSCVTKAETVAETSEALSVSVADDRLHFFLSFIMAL